MPLRTRLTGHIAALTLTIAALAPISCGPPLPPPVTVADVDPDPTPREHPSTFPDSRDGLIQTGFVNQFRRIPEEVYRDGIGYDYQDIRPELNLRIGDAIDAVKDRAQHPEYGFVSIARTELTAWYYTLREHTDQNSMNINNILHSLYGTAFDNIIEIIETPVDAQTSLGFQGKEYGFGIFPHKDASGTIQYDTPILYVGVLGHDVEGRWIGEKFVDYTPNPSVSARNLRGIIEQLWSDFLPQP